MSYTAARRQDERERRRTEILDAAERIAGEVGIEPMTMQQVAREARLSRALLYIYFRDKQDLHFGLCERALELLHDRFESAATRARLGREKLEAMGRAYVGFSREFPRHFEILARFETHESDLRKADGNVVACMNASDRVHDQLTGAIKAGIADRSIRADIGDPSTVAITLWGFMHGIIQIANKKAGILALRGVTPGGLVDQALRMTNLALGAKG